MNLNDLTTLDAIEAFLNGTQSVAFEVGVDKDERYRFIEQTLNQHQYRHLGKSDRGLIRAFGADFCRSLAPTQTIQNVSEQTKCRRQNPRHANPNRTTPGALQ